MRGSIRGRETVLLMDAPHQPDGPPVRGGRPYSRIAHLADDDMVRPFMAVGAVLQGAGLSAPARLAFDLDKGLLLVEDLGDRAFGREIAAGASQAELWRAAVDALIALRGVPVPASLPLPDGTGYTLPRRDREAFEIEIELLLDWYWPALEGGARAPRRTRRVQRALGAPCSTACSRSPAAGSCATITRPTCSGCPSARASRRVGIIDFQDALNEHFAFDLVSLLQDARVTVPHELEAELFAHYCAEIAKREPAFDRAAFRGGLCGLRGPAQYAPPGALGSIAEA